METLTFTAQSGITDFFVLPEGSQLAFWTANKRDASEVATGSYAVEVDPRIAKVWRLFRGSTQPASWNAWLQVFNIPSITVLPTQGQNDRDYSAASIIATTDADLPIGRTVLDAEDEPIDLPPQCDFVINDENRKHLATLVPVINGASYTVVVPRIHTKFERSIYFSLRKQDSFNTDFDSGTILFTFAATKPV